MVPTTHELYHKMCIKRRYGSLSTETAPALWGGYAEWVYLHPDSVVYPVADSLRAELAPLFIPISNGLDLIFTVGQYNLLAMVLNSVGVELDEGTEGIDEP